MFFRIVCRGNSDRTVVEWSSLLDGLDYIDYVLNSWTFRDFRRTEAIDASFTGTVESGPI